MLVTNMKLVLLLLVTVGFACAATVQLHIEQDEDDVVITTSGRFDWGSKCTPHLKEVIPESSFARASSAIVNFPKDTKVSIFKCQPTKIDCPMLEQPVAFPDFYVLDDSSVPVGVQKSQKDDDDVLLYFETNLSPFRWFRGTGKILKTSLAELKLEDGSKCKLTFKTKGFIFDGSSHLEIAVRDCKGRCSILGRIVSLFS